MTTPTPAAATSLPPRVVGRASAAVFAAFFLAGLNFASWASRLPAIRDGLGLSQGQVGLLLLVGSVGSLVALPLSGLVVERLGARRTVLAFAVLNAAGLTVGAVGVALGQVVVVAAGLLLFGVGTGVWDASMNMEGAAVERALGRSIMPRYHAGFSFGTVAAAALAAVLAGLDVPVVVHLPAVLLLSTVAVAVAVRSFLPGTDEAAPGADGPDHAGRVADPAAPADGPRRGAGGALDAWREPRTLLIGLVVLGAALTEGAANDWVSLAVVDGFGTTDAVGAVGFGVFVTAMTVGRIAGTRVLDRFGRVAVLRAAAVLAIVGLLAFSLVGPLWLALVGVVAWGLGAALGFPVGMSAAADDPARATARVSVVSTIGYSAFLAGPPLLGFLAEHVGYRTALLAVVVPVVVSLLVVRAAAPEDGPGPAPVRGAS
ncbi:MFS transporter [Cellulomonas marina]|uniref:Fucose permease n=1 Tax=Cellulomonas marina TaxID=988821 RepID=A0A1I0XL79_9CELL|nr:MFS transporter [Cellulomonas marina]GIG30122.1 MFS transporter [Cellulomonas marina]SFB01654.1 Fucose permease [Cellulomonas marina]